MVIKLTEEEMERCTRFAYECARNQQQIEFGQRDTAERDVPEIGRDNLIGKIAEVAFSKMLRGQYHIDIDLDFDLYPRGEWDGQDTVINGWKIDIKGTRSGGHWMLIEWSKLNFRQRDDDLSHMYVMASVGWDRNSDEPTGSVDIVGAVSLGRLKPGMPGVITLRKGDFIPGTGTVLQADNYGISFSDIKQDWDLIIRTITNEPPPETDSYPNPYSGETTAEIKSRA